MIRQPMERDWVRYRLQYVRFEYREDGYVRYSLGFVTYWLLRWIHGVKP